MRKLLKKCIAVICASAMLSAFAIPALATETAATGITVAAEFNNFDYYDNGTFDRTLGDSTGSNNQISPNTVAYGDGESSVAWKLQNNSQFAYTLNTPLTISSTDTIKIRMRATTGTQKVNVLINGSRKGTASVTEEWMEYSCTGFETLTSFGLQCGGWGLTESSGAYKTGARIYIDSIWVEEADAQYNKVDYPINGTDDVVAEIKSFNSPSQKVATLGSNWSESTSSTNTR